MAHPSRVIRGVRSRHLDGRRIVLGVSGSIAAIEAPRIARELIRHGADVVAVMSREATRLVTAEAMSFATGHPAVVELTGDVEHVSLLSSGEGRADLLLIAPATANTLSKIAHGIDDTPVTSFASVALGGGVPVLLAPAMHADMGKNPAVRENLARLREFGVGFIDPVRAEGEEKIAPPEVIAAAVVHRLAQGPLAQRRVLVIGGASHEPLDAVRSITNESSGGTALALAAEAYLRGAEVTLWVGALHRPVPPFLSPEAWGSIRDLLARLRRPAAALDSYDAILVPAALADFSPNPAEGKIDSRQIEELQLRIPRAPKVLPEIRRRAGASPRLVAFKLEAGTDDEQLFRRARALAAESGATAVVANRPSNLGSDRAEVAWVGPVGDPVWIQGTKAEVAAGILDRLSEELPGPVTSRSRMPPVGPTRAGGTHRRRRGSSRSRPRRKPA